MSKVVRLLFFRAYIGRW